MPTSRPIHAMLRGAALRRSWHMPGHKGRAPFGPEDLYALDTTELAVTDDLYRPGGAIAEAQTLYARAAGAGASLFLHNGSTAGVHAMLQLWARPGDTVLLPRSAHLSAVHACVLGGLRPVWMPVRVTGDGYPWLPEETVLEALAAHPEAKALLLTRPDYWGGCIPLERVIRAAHALGVRVAVDEAHGAHLPWLGTPASAGACGADAWVQSTHKTLPALTGTAVLHLRDGAEAPRALAILRREQTSSPSHLLLMSIDDARAWMEENGEQSLKTLCEALAALCARLPALGYDDAHAGWAETGYAFDPTRLVITAPQGGEALEASLRALGADVEMADSRRAVCICTAMDSPADIRALGDLLAAVPPAPAREEIRQPAHPLPPQAMPPQAMPPREAALGETAPVPLAECAGRIAAASAGLYPPGIPLVCPGEMITEEIAEALRAAGPDRRFGTDGDMLWCVKPSSSISTAR